VRAALVIAIAAACRGGADEPPPAPPPPAPVARIAPIDAAPACQPDAHPCETTFTSDDHASDYFVRTEYTPAGKVAVERMFAVDTGLQFKSVFTTYDAKDRAVQVDTRDSNDTLTFVEHYEYKGADRDPSVARFDTDGDGKVDKIERHRYYRRGDLHIDDEDDGRFHTRYEKRFDAAGHMISHGQFAIGYPRGPGDKANEFEYDDHGHEIRETQWYRDGRPDYWTTSNQYDACGNLVRHDDDWHDDGHVDETTTYRYDCAGDH
jgi:hypothetical protein